MDPIDRGHGAGLAEIYKRVEEVRRAPGRSVPKSLDAVVRGTLEENSSDSEKFKDKDTSKDIFYMAEGKGGGIWGLRSKRRTQ